MKNAVTIFIIIVVVSFLNDANALEKSSVVITNLAGNATCGEYVHARNNRSTIVLSQYQQWISGYFTGIQIFKKKALKDPHQIELATEEAGMLWLENYCTKMPLESFLHAVQTLHKELVNNSWK